MLPCNHECNDGSDWLLGASDIEKQQQTGHCNRLTTVQDIQDYASLIFLGCSVVLLV